MNKHFPQDLTTLTPEQHQECIVFLSNLSFGELRRRQAITQEQITDAIMQKNDAGLRNLQVREMHLIEAIMAGME